MGGSIISHFILFLGIFFPYNLIPVICSSAGQNNDPQYCDEDVFKYENLKESLKLIPIKDEGGESVMEVLSNEIEELNKVIHLTRRKTEILEQIRNAALLGQRLPEDWLNHVSRSANFNTASNCKASPEPQERGDTTTNTRTTHQNRKPSNDDLLQNETSLQSSGKTFDDYMLHRSSTHLFKEGMAVVPTAFTIARINSPRLKSRKRGATPPLVLLIVADTSKDILFYDMSSGEGKLLKSFPSGHESPITNIAFNAEGSSHDALLVTSSGGDKLGVHNVTIWNNGNLFYGNRIRIVAEGRERFNEIEISDETSSNPVALPPADVLIERMSPSVESGFFVELRTSTTRSTEDRLVTINSETLYSMEIYHRKRMKKEIIVGNGNGKILFYDIEGVQLNEIDIVSSSATSNNNIAVRVMSISHSKLVYAAGSDIGVIQLSKNQITSTCKGVVSSISSVAFDVLKPDVIHAGTVSGEIITFHSKYTKRKQKTDSSASNRSCKLIQKYSSGYDKESMYVAGIKGYVFWGLRGIVGVHNVTDMVRSEGEIQYLFSKSISNNDGNSSVMLMDSNTLHASSRPEVALMAVYISKSNTINIYESILPYKTYSADMGWIRSPIIMISVAIVVIYYLRFKKSSSGFSVPSSSYNGGGKFDNRDFERMTQSMLGSEGRGRHHTGSSRKHHHNDESFERRYDNNGTAGRYSSDNSYRGESAGFRKYDKPMFDEDEY